MSQRSEHYASADGCFSDLMRRAGRESKPYSCGAEWIKNDSNRLHIVQRYDATGLASVVFKHAARPKNVDEFSKILEAHNEADAALSGSNGNTVPKIIAQDVDHQAYLMEFFPGETFLDQCRSADDHKPLLQKAGAWIAAYHRGTFREERAFRPKFMARHMMHLANQMESGERRIQGQKRFIELANKLQLDAPLAHGYIGKIAAKHGDLNAHNLMMSETETAGFDFLGRNDAPVAYDIARFLLSYVQFVGDLDNIPKGHVLPPDVMTAFWSGYDFIDPSDPSVAFLLKTQVLTDWNRLSSKRNANGTLRLARIRKIARQAFA